MTFKFFLESKTSFAIFVGSRLKDIFHWWTHLLIFSRSLFRLFAVSLTFLTTENRDVWSVNSLDEQQSSEEGSLIWKRKNTGCKIDPWGTRVVFLFHLQVCPFNTNLWYLSDEKLSISFMKSPFMLLRLSLYNSPWRQAMSKAFEISRNTPHTLGNGLLSKALYTSWEIIISCSTHESPGIKPDW